MERRLGRGLGSLLSDLPRPQQEAPGELELDRIHPNPYQPRREFSPEALQELRESIARHGVLQPVVVRPAAEGQYELISGERRCRASRLAGRRTIPAIVRQGVGDPEMLELALVENLQRRDLDPIERARGFQRLQRDFGLTQEEVAGRVGLRRSTVANHLRLLELPEEVRSALAGGRLTMGHARALLGAGSPEALRSVFETTVRDGLSVREVERRIRAQADSGTPAEPAGSAADAGGSSGAAAGGSSRPPQPPEPWVGAIEARLREALGTQVRLENRPGSVEGRIVVEYYDRPGLEALLEKLAPPALL